MKRFQIGHETFKQFLTTDPDRPEFQTGFNWEGYLCATDGISILMIPGEVQGAQRTTRAIEKLIPQRQEGPNILSIPRLKATFARIPDFDKLYHESVTKPEPEKCKSCQGKSETYCRRCGVYHECQCCSGTGNIDGEMPALNRERSIPIQYRGVPIVHYLLERLVRVAEDMGESTVDAVSMPIPDKGQEFMFQNGVRVLLMPMRLGTTRMEPIILEETP